MGSWKNVACLLDISCVKAVGTLLAHSQYRDRGSSHQLGGSFIPGVYLLTQTFSCSTGSGMGHLGLAPLVVVGPAEGVVLVLGLAPLAVAECCWSPSFFGTVASGHVRCLVATGVLWLSPHLWVVSSRHFQEADQVSRQLLCLTQILQVWRSILNCFHIRLLLWWAPLFGVPWLKGWGTYSSLHWGCDGPSETHLEGCLWEAWGHLDLLVMGSTATPAVQPYAWIESIPLMKPLIAPWCWWPLNTCV